VRGDCLGSGATSNVTTFRVAGDARVRVPEHAAEGEKVELPLEEGARERVT
jgi:hypothetical protein